MKRALVDEEHEGGADEAMAAEERRLLGVLRECASRARRGQGESRGEFAAAAAALRSVGAAREMAAAERAGRSEGGAGDDDWQKKRERTVLARELEAAAARERKGEGEREGERAGEQYSRLGELRALGQTMGELRGEKAALMAVRREQQAALAAATAHTPTLGREMGELREYIFLEEEEEKEVGRRLEGEEELCVVLLAAVEELKRIMMTRGGVEVAVVRETGQGMWRWSVEVRSGRDARVRVGSDEGGQRVAVWTGEDEGLAERLRRGGVAGERGAGGWPGGWQRTSEAHPSMEKMIRAMEEE